MLENDRTKLEIIAMDGRGMTKTQIAEELGLRRETVRDFLNRESWQVFWASYDKRNQQPVLTKGEEVHNLGDNIIVISDTHFPYQHPDTFSFLSYLKDKYDITGSVHVGDVNDNHYPSYHEKEYDCYSGADELKYSREACQQLEELFPNLLICEGNHDILAKRKAQSADIPLEWVAHPNEIYGLKGGWLWDNHHYFWAGDNKCLLVHSVGINTRTNSQKYSHCSVQGHHHSEYGISYVTDTDTIRWAMSVGCLINPASPAFRYDKNLVVRRPVLGCGVIINGCPILEPMVLKSDGRWRGPQ